VTAPIELRAKAVRRELEETKLLTQRLEARDADLRELRKILKDKQEELSQAQLRKEMVERKFENLTKESNATREKLEVRICPNFGRCHSLPLVPHPEFISHSMMRINEGRSIA